MDYTSLDDFIANAEPGAFKGPVAMIFVEDLIEVESTIQYHLKAGFKPVIVFAPAALSLPDEMSSKIHRVRYDLFKPNAVTSAVNRLISEVPPGTWIYYCYNAEYLFFPFCETRTVAELLAFHTEERRSAMLAYAVDLYAADLDTAPNAVDLQNAMIDKSGYYALARKDADGSIKDRQLDFHGGLRWRFEEFVPKERRKIDRVALFRAAKGLELQNGNLFNVEEYNTYACPWHHNLTAVVASFRVAKALKFNPGSTFDITTFKWYHSVPFEWHSQQLMDLGLMEPGQWF
ncbi:hypothetical protein [Albirhodobacter sp. R86504]|uniref:hypothetical protein n=1 Tax=Albirhodobacter sp. R86504 TaxID=3093848 RepID=UPI00366E84EA